MGAAVLLVLLDPPGIRLLADRSPAASIAGGALSLAGTGLAAWAKLHLGIDFTGNLGLFAGHRLRIDGPYRIVRHPIYLGILLFAAGSGLAWNQAPFLVLALYLAVCFGFQIRLEERLLAAGFGEAHERYRGSVPALLPWPRPRRRA